MAWKFDRNTTQKTAIWWGAGILGLAIGVGLGFVFGTTIAIILAPLLGLLLFRVFSKYCAPRLYEAFHPKKAKADEARILEANPTLQKHLAQKARHAKDTYHNPSLDATLQEVVNAEPSLAPVKKLHDDFLGAAEKTKQQLDASIDLQLRQAIVNDFNRCCVTETGSFLRNIVSNTPLLYRGLCKR